MQTETLEEILKIIPGKLIEILPKYKLKSILNSAEIMALRVKEKGSDLSKRIAKYGRSFYTANVPVYTVENGEAVLYFGGKKEFQKIIGKNINDFVSEIRATENYNVKDNDFKWIKEQSNKKDSGVERYELSKLDLIEHDNEYSYFEINTANFDILNSEQKRFAENIYGKGENFKKSMEALRKEGITTTKVYVLNQKYVKSKTQENKGISRACWLGSVVGNSIFDAVDRIIDYDVGALVGVPLIAKGGAKKTKDTITPAYTILTKNVNKGFLK